MSESRFPILDFDRESDEELSSGREIFEEVVIEPAIDETGDWIAMPVRSGMDSFGPRFEIGPYSLTESDIARLHNALRRHIYTFPTDFRPAAEGAR